MIFALTSADICRYFRGGSMEKNVICPTQFPRMLQAAHIGPVLNFSNKTFSLEQNFLSEDRSTAK